MARKYALFTIIILLVAKVSYHIGSNVFQEVDVISRLAGTLAIATVLYGFTIFILRRANVIRVRGLDITAEEKTSKR
jgi:hypothetical protein